MACSPPALSACTAALLLVITGILVALVDSGTIVSPPDKKIVNITTYQKFDVDALEEIWRFRVDAFPYFLAIDGLSTIAMILIVHVSGGLKNLHKGLRTRLHTYMHYCFCLGALLPTLEFLQNLGSYGVADVMVNWPGWPLELYPALEVSYLLSTARGIWVYSMQFIFIGAGFLFAAFLSFQFKKLHLAHGIFGLICALLSFLVFIFELIAFSDLEKFGGALAVTLGLWSIAVYPLWLLGTAFALRNFVPKYYEKKPETKVDEVPLADRSHSKAKKKAESSSRSAVDVESTAQDSD